MSSWRDSGQLQLNNEPLVYWCVLHGQLYLLAFVKEMEVLAARKAETKKASPTTEQEEDVESSPSPKRRPRYPKRPKGPKGQEDK